MEISKLNQIIIFFVFISFAAAQEIKVAVPDNENKLKLECENDTLISFLVNSSNIWTKSFDENCPNRNMWDTLGITLVIVFRCNIEQNCTIDLTNITMGNCTDYRKYLNVKYTCNTTETTTEITTTVKSEPDDDDDDDDDSEEDKSTTTTTTTKKPPGPLRPAYLPLPVPSLLTTLKPTRRPYHFPQPRLPVPQLMPRPQLPPLFSPMNNYNGGGYNFQPPIILPLPLPAPIPIPVFG